MGSGLLVPEIALWVFLGLYGSFLYLYTFFFFFFLITWFWIDQQTCLFAQLDLNWLLVQTSGGFSVWLRSSLSRKTSSPIFSIFADREPAGLLFESTSECTIWPKKKKKDHSFRFVEFGCFIFGHSASLSCCFTFLWNSVFCGSFSKFSLHCQLLWTNGRQLEFCKECSSITVLEPEAPVGAAPHRDTLSGGLRLENRIITYSPKSVNPAPVAVCQWWTCVCS